MADAGYTTPTPIQAQAIPLVLSGRDLVGTAQTGTGKTAGFTLPMINILGKGRARARMPRSLILEPTRELAAQVAENFDTYGRYHKLTKALLIGGVSYGDQESAIKRGADVLIATPGRLLDHIERGGLLMADIRIVVIDEADRMLDMGFIPDIEKIFKLLPKRRQTLMFSATMPKEIRRLAETYLSDPLSVSVASPDKPAETVVQGLVRTPEDPKAKRDVLRALLRSETPKNAIIFCNRKRDVATLARALERDGFNAAPLHGDMSQPDRIATLDRFREGKIMFLVASDVAARGLDISDMSHVVNFDVPNHAEDYIHRVGRTGRAGRSGRAITLTTADDGKRLAAIEALIGRRIPPLNLATAQVAIVPAVTVVTAVPAPAAIDPAPVAIKMPTAIPATASEPLPQSSDKPRRGRRRRGRSEARTTNESSAHVETVHQPEPHIQPERHAPRPHVVHAEPAERGGDRSERVTGMGDHVPAFLLR